MAIHTDDLLEKLDRALSQPYLAPATHCGWCYRGLTGREASLDFCQESCQWHWRYARSAGQMEDTGRGEESWVSDAQTWLSHQAFAMWVERDRVERMGRMEQVARQRDHGGHTPDSRRRALDVLAEWLGIDPDS